MLIAKWGNSLAVRLPAKLVEELGLKEGDQVELRRAPDGVLEVVKTPDPKEAIRALRKYRGLVPADYRFRREDAYPSNRGGSDDDVDD